MKKLLSLILAALLFLAPTCQTLAAESTQSPVIASKIEIAFKVGEDSIKINGKEIKGEKPVTVNGTTLVPLRVITEAFGAEVIWNGDENSATLKYSGVIIKVYVDNKEALVDGKSITLPEAPTVIDEKMMVPLRFITENFGAEVKYDSKTEQVLITKEIAGTNSIKDFSLLLKKTNKERIGDSYYGWSISLPKNLKIQYRNFDGSVVYFNADDESYLLSLYITQLGNDDINSLTAKEIENAKKYTIIDQGRVSKAGQEYIKTVYKSDKLTYDDRIFIKDNRVYHLILAVKDFEKYKSSAELTALLDSFSLLYKKGDALTEDLSDVTADGCRPYENKKLKWTINIPSEWKEYKYKDKVNIVSFFNSEDSELNIEMYSIESGLTLESWVDNEKNDIKEEYNPLYVNLIKTEDCEINKTKCKKLYLNEKVDEKLYYRCDAYFMGKNYRYHLTYRLKSDGNSFNTNMINDIEKALNSFKFSEPNPDDVGKLIDPEKISLSGEARKLENKTLKWSLNMPGGWTAGKDNNNSDKVIYENNSKHMYFVMNVYTEKAFEDKMKSSSSSSSQEVDYILDKNEMLGDKETKVTRLEYTVKTDKYKGKEIVYLLKKNGYVYIISIGIEELRYTEKNIKIMDDIWKSMKFE